MRTLIGLFLLSAMLPIVLLGAILGALSFSNEKAALERQARDWARFSATLVSREIIANQRSVQMVTQSPAFDGQFDQVRFELLARRLVADEPLWRALSVSDATGMRIVDVPGPIGGKARGPVVDMASLKLAVATQRPVAGNIIKGPNGRQAFAVRAPVVRGGQVQQVVSAVVDPSRLATLLRPAQADDGWSVQAIDGSGRVVADAKDPRVIGLVAKPQALAALKDSQSGLKTRSGPGRAKAVGLTEAVPGTDWHVYVAVPYNTYVAPTRRAAAVLLLGALAGVGMGLLMIRLMRMQLSRWRQQQVAILENQRLEALGLMTGGIAHDFNNLLTPIIGGLDLLRRRFEDDPRALRILDGAMESAERSRALVSRLLAFARRQSLAPRDTDIRDLLEGLKDLLERSVGSSVSVELQVDDGDLCATVDPAQLELAILNLAVNARDAMPEGGVLTITAEEVVTKQTRHLRAGGYIRLTVSDTGIGMDAETLQRAIEPFYTTKEVGRGTGLGLSMVHGVAAQSGGALLLTSEPGKGTQAQIWLPVGQAPQRPIVQNVAEPGPRTATLLLVDDERLVRAATADILKDHGHEVIEASSAAEALRLLQATPRIDAIVSDYAMPGQTGGDLALAARRLRPDLPILLITGFAATEAFPPDVPYLGKPFRRGELLTSVSQLLDGSASSS